MLTSGAQNYSKINAVNIFLKFNLASLTSIVDIIIKGFCRQLSQRIIKNRYSSFDYHKGLSKNEFSYTIIIRDYQKKMIIKFF